MKNCIYLMKGLYPKKQMIILGKLIAQKNSIKISILPISNKFNKIQNNLNRTQELKQNNIIYDGVED